MSSRRSLLIFATLASTGCTLLVSTSGLTTDGSTSVPDASDAPAIDEPPVEAGPADGGNDVVEAGPASPCTGTHLFCDDFDRTSDPASGWTDSDVTDKGVLSLSPTRAVTLPKGLFAKLPRRNPADALELATVTQAIAKDFSKILVSYDLFVEKPDFMPGDINVGVGCFSGRHDNTRGSTCMSIGADYTSVFNAQLGPWPWDTWVHVELTMPVDGSPSARITSSAGSKTAGGDYELAPDLGAPEVRMQIGLQSYNKPAPGFTAYYDNVVLDIE